MVASIQRDHRRHCSGLWRLDEQAKDKRERAKDRCPEGHAFAQLRGRPLQQPEVEDRSELSKRLAE